MMIWIQKTPKLSVYAFCLSCPLTQKAGHLTVSRLPTPMGLTGEINCTVMQLPDVFLGGSFYYPISAYHGLSCYGSFAMRAGRRTVLEKTGPSEYTQFKELRLLWDVGLNESISFSNKTGLYARGGLGFSHRWCKGSNAGTSITPTPALQAGAFVIFDSEYRYRLRLGYNFAKAGTSGPHGVILSFQFGGLLWKFTHYCLKHAVIWK